MRTIELPWETWQAVIAVLREKAVPYMPEHADILERQLKQHGPDEATVRLSLTDHVFPRRLLTCKRTDRECLRPLDGEGPVRDVAARRSPASPSMIAGGHPA